MVTETLGYQLSPQQKRQWKIQQGQKQFCAQATLSIRGALDSQRLRAALQRLVDRHEILRTGFQIGPDAEHSLQVVSTGNLEWNEQYLNGFEQEEIAERLAHEVERIAVLDELRLLVGDDCVLGPRTGSSRGCRHVRGSCAWGVLR